MEPTLFENHVTTLRAALMQTVADYVSDLGLTFNPENFSCGSTCFEEVAREALVFGCDVVPGTSSGSESTLAN